MFVKTKTPLINANSVPLAFGANGAALLAPASAAASRVRPWRQMHAWLVALLGCSARCLAALLGCTLAPFLAALLDCYGSCLLQYTFSQIMFKWFTKTFIITNHGAAMTLQTNHSLSNHEIDSCFHLRLQNVWCL